MSGRSIRKKENKHQTNAGQSHRQTEKPVMNKERANENESGKKWREGWGVVIREEARREATGRLRVRVKRDGGKDGWMDEGTEREGNAGEEREEVVVLRSVRMSAFPLSGDGAHRLCMSVTPLIYASLQGRGKGR